MANTTGEWPKNRYEPVTEKEIDSAGYIKAQIPIPDMPDSTESLWFKVIEVFPKLKKVEARLQKRSYWQPDMKLGTKMSISYDQIVDTREGATINVEETLRSMD